ncbi:MAG: primosomal protein N' [Anaerolineales bacterium]|uniref:replication restart helicase PriA n=1 Tax=Candidatus Villigracilis affinis TaxID=3140682 RepID=UPI001D48625A|nr:primosomal protein N' [Anaerolineales bacterium]MBK9603169.1 primosomal protein N' [Anaerolineales bacterium]
MFARVAVNVSVISGLFDYAIPNELALQIQAGSFVIVPFGKQTVQGIVTALIDSPAVENPKLIIDLLDPAPVLTQPQLALAMLLADSTLNPLAAIISLMLPVGLSQQADVNYELRITNYEDKTSTVTTRLLTLLRERGPLRGRQIDSHFSRVDWRKTAQSLVKKGILTTKHVLPPPRVRSKFVRVAQLSVTPEAAEAEMDSLGTKQTLARRQSALRFLIQQPEAINLSWVYAETGCNLADLQELEERGLIRLFENEIFRDSLERTSKQVEQETGTQAFELTPEQTSALEKITHSSFILQPSSFLLHGVTGSGKTEIYLRAAEETIKRGKQAIILVPEIALTPQAVRRFLARFPGQVGLIHSKLSEGERYDTWRRARSGKLKVIIGARSALFAPLPNIGLIVVDECHDSSYHQGEPPFYNAATAAQEYARLCGAVCVLGSATPTVEQRFAAENGTLTKLTLPNRVTDSALPPVQVVDMREELKTGNRGIFSRALAESLAETISRGEQAILFLNRRGTATYIFCRDCGFVLKCPNCDTPLTLHVGTFERSNVPTLLCHHCGYTRQKPKTCPNCSGKQIREYGLGSEKVEEEVQAMFPGVRTLRWDWDTTRHKDAHEMILTHFANHQADVLVGTQMLSKGLDLPLVTLVGIVLADVGLNLPDPFASEKVFQTLTQVAGRAGRSSLGGKVVLQTFMPEHYAIQFAAGHDVNGFYERELDYRKQLGYPPFAKLVRLEFRDADPLKAESDSQKAADKLKLRIETENRRQTELIGPVPAFFSKVDGIHRWQIILRGPDPASLLRDLKLSDCRVEVDPISLL